MPSVDNILRAFQLLGKDTEVPETFMVWGGISLISAALRRQVYVDMGLFNVYPNTYIVLVGGSGRAKKSTAVNFAKAMLSGVPDIKFIAQKITPEGLIESMKGVKDSIGFAVADELNVLISPQALEAGLGGVLIQLHDCLDPFQYTTKTKGDLKLPRSCLTLLGGSTIAGLRRAIPESMIGEGLTSRILFVYVDDKVEPIYRPTMTDEKRSAMEWIRCDVQRILQISGEMKISSSADSVLKESYERFFRSSPFYQVESLTGSCGRRQTHFLKLATIFSVAESSSLVIEDRHLHMAELFLTENVEKNLPRVIRMLSQTEVGSQREEVLAHIKFTHGKISRSDLSRKMSHKCDARTLSEIIVMLLQEEEIVCEDKNGTLFYVVKEKS